MNFQFLFLITIIKHYFTFSFGIDFGSELNKSAFIVPGKFYTSVEDQMSKRKSESIITFCGDKKFYEYQGAKKSLKKTCNSYNYLTKYFETNDLNYLEKLSKIKHTFYDNIKTSEDKYGILFDIKLENFPIEIKQEENSENENNNENKKENKNKKLRLQEIFGLILKNIKKNANKTSGLKFTGASLNIWDNSLSIQARKKLISSLTLAGLKPISFQHENTAAIVYHLAQNPIKKNTKKFLLIINIGSLSTKLSIYKIFNTKEVRKDKKIIYNPSVKNLFDKFYMSFSGRLLNYCLSDFVLGEKKNLIDDFKKKKLMSVLNKVKERLSVNRNSSVHIEDFFQDMPLSKKFTRNEFEQNCHDIFGNLKKILVDFKRELKEKQIKYNIDDIEIIGGTVRIPKVKEIIKKFYDRELGTHMNGDNGPSLGAAFIAANYSNGTRTKKVIMEDGPNYSVNVTVRFDNRTSINEKDNLENENKEKNLENEEEENNLEKKNDEDDLENKNVNENGELENKNLLDGYEYKKTQLYPFKSKYGSKRNIGIKDLNSNVYVDINIPEQNYNINYKVKGIPIILEKYKKKNITSSKVFFLFELDLFGIPHLNGAELRIQELVLEKEKEKKKEKNKKNEKLKKKKYKKNNIKEKLNVIKLNETYKGLYENKEDLLKSKNLLKKIDEFEKFQEKISQQKNKLESVIYKMQDILENENLSKYLSETEKKVYKKKYEEGEKFLFSEKMTKMKISDFATRIKNLNIILNPFNFRKEENEKRDENFKNCFKVISNYFKIAEKIKKTRKWIPKEKIENIFEKLKKARNFFREKLDEQKIRALYLNPILSSDEIFEKLENLKKNLYQLKRISKPKKKNKKKNKFQKKN